MLKKKKKENKVVQEWKPETRSEAISIIHEDMRLLGFAENGSDFGIILR